MPSNRLPLLGLLILSSAMFGFFYDKPVHLDEANFLAMTKGSFWSPHNIMINWQGTEQRAFDVLSNPPGIVWYLWPVRDADVVLQRLWLLPWSFLALFGCWRFAQRINVDGFTVALGVLATPFFWISNASPMPDMALFACVVLGVGGLFGKKNLHLWAFIAGMSAIFRYSGITMIPLVMAWVIFYHHRKNFLSLTLAVSGPTLLLFVHNMLFYEKWHFFHMLSFQSEQASGEELIHKLAAFLAMLTGGFFLPFGKNYWRLVPLLIALVFASLLFVCIEPKDVTSIWHCVFILMGSYIYISTVWKYFIQGRTWEVLWCVGALLFLINLRFAATRYWAPFFLPFLIVWIQQASVRAFYSSVVLYWFIGFGLAYDDYGLSKAQYGLVQQLSRYPAGYFSGHWGWQFYLQEAGWVAIEEDGVVPSGTYHVQSKRSWPQTVSNQCWDKEVVLTPQESPFYLRVHSAEGRVNYHSYLISDDPPIRSYAPWGIGTDKWDYALLRRACSR